MTSEEASIIVHDNKVIDGVAHDGSLLETKDGLAVVASDGSAGSGIATQPKRGIDNGLNNGAYTTSFDEHELDLELKKYLHDMPDSADLSSSKWDVPLSPESRFDFFDGTEQNNANPMASVLSLSTTRHNNLNSNLSASISNGWIKYKWEPGNLYQYVMAEDGKNCY